MVTYLDVAHRDLVEGSELQLLLGISLGSIVGTVVVVCHRHSNNDGHTVHQSPDENLEACIGDRNGRQEGDED